MAEGWARALHPGVIEASSAGTRASSVNPLAVRAMREEGIDISGHRSKSIEEFLGNPPDLVITVCDDAREACPAFPGATRVIHAGFEDPPRLAAQARCDDEALPHYRRIRDEIRAFVQALPAALGAE